MPPEIVFTAYSGFVQRFGNAPADYSEIIVYAGEKTLEEIKKRFPEKKGPVNLIVLKADETVLRKAVKNVVPSALLFVDLWNCREWYAKDFLNALREELLK